MKRKVSIALGLALLCASVGLGQGGGTIEGTVYAAPGRNLAGTVVIACLFENETCSETRSKVASVQASAPSARFQIAGLEPASYLVLAWRDLNANGEVEAGDELAVVVKDGQPQLIAPPASRLELRLQVFTGDFGALRSQAQATTVVAPPSLPSSPATSSVRALIGVWGTTRASPVDLVNPAGLVVSGGGSAISYEFKADGRFSYAGILEVNNLGMSTRTVIFEEGTYAVKGDTLSLQYRHRERFWIGGTLQSDKNSNGTDTYRWSIGPTSSNDGTLALYLTDQDGLRTEYPRQ